MSVISLQFQVHFITELIHSIINFIHNNTVYNNGIHVISYAIYSNDYHCWNYSCFIRDGIGSG